MLQIEVPGQELFNDETQEFIYTKTRTLNLEHSLISLSKWESKWAIPFLKKRDLTADQTIDYIRFMTIDKNVDDNVYKCLTQKNLDDVLAYIEKPMTATWFNDRDNSPSREVITSEIIYYYMIELGIPFECQKWHLNRLMTLIKVCNLKRSGGKKMKPQEILNQNRALNEQRKRQLNTRG